MIHSRIRARTEEAERRWQVRRDVQIHTSARSASDGPDESDGYAARIRNLSENGMLVESDAPLGPRDSFEIDIPEFGPCPAEVVWTKGDLKGCRFFAPLPKSVVSAAVLRSPVEEADAALYEQLRQTRMIIDDEERRHLPHALSVPAMALILAAEIAVIVYLVAVG
ncbi:PilZ domain-containing protein [Croceicoccus naphthovorans]|uniref:Uncharacterized protein n=1 Tax=Croceicoccus naphthovorans TaxID=1348774 RepID=A0A0G3XDG2_9SPHN|nr:PilZ domain-containing protein [Croceicoccus naphthovorans]AKM09570.1 hypothetical protein AB433_05610 [Croceicoccus naphthovorans]MBB3989663.1 hypothetical protein [Croceicoccus naphthovorans]